MAHFVEEARPSLEHLLLESQKVFEEYRVLAAWLDEEALYPPPQDESSNTQNLATVLVEIVENVARVEGQVLSLGLLKEVSTRSSFIAPPVPTPEPAPEPSPPPALPDAGAWSSSARRLRTEVDSLMSELVAELERRRYYEGSPPCSSPHCCGLAYCRDRRSRVASGPCHGVSRTRRTASSATGLSSWTSSRCASFLVVLFAMLVGCHGLLGGESTPVIYM
jgi:hypothetical protein